MVVVESRLLRVVDKWPVEPVCLVNLVGGGERESDEEVDFEFREEGVEEDDEESDPAASASNDLGHDDEEGGWEARFARFKSEQRAAGPASEGSDVDFRSEGGDTIGTLPQFSVIGGKKRRKGSSDASGYSMSSSSMFRNQGLTTLDERFDRVGKAFTHVNCALKSPVDTKGIRLGRRAT